MAPPATVGSAAVAPSPPSAEAQPGSVEPAAVQDTGTARERLLEGMRSLDRGDPDAARRELEAVLRLEAGNEVAKSLLWQIDAIPEQVLGRESFPYTVQPGDSLSKISKKFLGDSNKFYVLARYNGIRVPGGLEVGQVLKIPGKRPSAPGPAKAPPPASAPAEVPPPKDLGRAVGDGESGQAAERAYQGGLQALSAKSLEKAYDQFSQALKANPRHAGAQEKMKQVKPALVEVYYKRALAAFHKHDLDETIKFCNKALELDPDNEKVRLRRSEAEELQERLKKLR